MTTELPTVNIYKMSTKAAINRFNAVAARTEDNLKKNPFSDTYSLQQFDTHAKDYGRPPPGSKTEARGVKAGVHVMREILFLCETINENAEGEAPHRWIKFGKLFYIYSFYSDKLVGMLIRARKYGLVHFEGEMLYQRQDDEKLVTMMMSIQDIREKMKPSGDPKNCVALEKVDISGFVAPTPPEEKATGRVPKKVWVPPSCTQSAKPLDFGTCYGKAKPSQNTA